MITETTTAFYVHENVLADGVGQRTRSPYQFPGCHAGLPTGLALLKWPTYGALKAVDEVSLGIGAT